MTSVRNSRCFSRKGPVERSRRLKSTSAPTSRVAARVGSEAAGAAPEVEADVAAAAAAPLPLGPPAPEALLPATSAGLSERVEAPSAISSSAACTRKGLRMRRGTSSNTAEGDSPSSASALRAPFLPRSASHMASDRRSALMESWPCAVRTPS